MPLLRCLTGACVLVSLCGCGSFAPPPEIQALLAEPGLFADSNIVLEPEADLPGLDGCWGSVVEVDYGIDAVYYRFDMESGTYDWTFYQGFNAVIGLYGGETGTLTSDGDLLTLTAEEAWIPGSDGGTESAPIPDHPAVYEVILDGDGMRISMQGLDSELQRGDYLFHRFDCP